MLIIDLMVFIKCSLDSVFSVYVHTMLQMHFVQIETEFDTTQLCTKLIQISDQISKQKHDHNII